MAGVWSEFSSPPTQSVFDHQHLYNEKISLGPRTSFSWKDVTTTTKVPHAKHSPARKTVRFSSSIARSNDKAIKITPGERRKLWWRKAEMARMKCQIQANVISDFRARNYLRSFHRVYNRVIESESTPVAEVEKLVLTVGVAMGYRGMEMWGGSAVGSHRLKRIKWVVDGVLHVQTKSLNGNLRPEQRAEILRMTSEYLTRPSSQLALLLGGIDAKAASIDQPFVLANATCNKQKTKTV